MLYDAFVQFGSVLSAVVVMDAMSRVSKVQLSELQWLMLVRAAVVDVGVGAVVDVGVGAGFWIGRV